MQLMIVIQMFVENLLMQLLWLEIGKKSHQIDTCAIIIDKSDTCLNLNDCEFNMMERQ